MKEFYSASSRSRGKIAFSRGLSKAIGISLDYSPFIRLESFRALIFLGGFHVNRTNPAARIRTGNGQHSQSSGTNPRRQMELETARKIRNHGLARGTCGNSSWMADHDAEHRKPGLRSVGRAKLRKVLERIPDDKWNWKP